MSAAGSARRVIDDRFELLDRLGSGGMGTVWRARDLALDREVAVKEVRPPDPALVAALLWTFLPVPDDGAGEAARSPSASSAAGKPVERTKPEAPDAPGASEGSKPAGKAGLLTPDGIRASARELTPLMGGGKVTSFVVYPEHVSAQALVKGSTKRYDSFSYRGGDSATRDGAGAP